MTDAVVIGAGPAGLMAAEQLALAGLSVTVAEAKPSVARKFLMAGKSGLNLTKNDSPDEFLDAYCAAESGLKMAISQFGPQQVKDWAQELGQEIFVGTSGRVFPKSMKASPLLRAWLGRLDELGVQFRTRWRLVDISDALVFETPDGTMTMAPLVTVLAMGGASWGRLGSDGKWAGLLRNKGVEIAGFRPSNVGLTVNWSDHMSKVFGQPVKAVELKVGGQRIRSEFVVTATGLEGSGIYEASRHLRDGGSLSLDLLPDWSIEKITDRLARQKDRTTKTNKLRKALGMSKAKIALFMEFGDNPTDIDDMAKTLKSLVVGNSGFRPLDEAISTAGGVRIDALDEQLMLTVLPGVFCAGEMIDWDAPTGGYLITGCLATGRFAGMAAATYARAIVR